MTEWGACYYDELICECDMPIEGCAGIVFHTDSMSDPRGVLFKVGRDKQLYQKIYQRDETNASAELLLPPENEVKNDIKNRFEKSHYTGEIRFFDSAESDDSEYGRLTFSAYFINGMLKELVHISGAKIQKRFGAVKGLLKDIPSNPDITDEESRDDAIAKRRDT
jgi:hypothetical protein